MTLHSTPWPAGTPCWVDLAVPDLAAARAFYGAVLGWSFTEPDEASGGYVMARVRGADAAGLGPMMSPDAPVAWTVYLACDDVDRTVDAVTARGGTVHLPPGDVGPYGRMAMAADPGGGVFGLWQAGTTIGCGVVGEAGAMCWRDLRSTDPAAAQAFFQAVFGYLLQPVPMAVPDYSTFARPDDPDPLGGIGPMMGEPTGDASHWLVYFGVPDAAAAVAAARAGGGELLGELYDSPFGPMATLRDPAGAVFLVVQVPAPVDGG